MADKKPAFSEALHVETYFNNQAMSGQSGTNNEMTTIRDLIQTDLNNNSGYVVQHISHTSTIDFGETRSLWVTAIVIYQKGS